MVKKQSNEVLNSMEDGNPLILLNSEEPQGNTKFRALVQTPKKLKYPEYGGIEMDYSPESIKGAIGSLVGEQIADGSHFSDGTNEFATVYDAGYCPRYGGYVDFEVFKPEYVPLFNNIAKNIKEKGIYPKKGFSTEPDVLKATPTGRKSARIDEMKYKGLTWTNWPRDKDTGICKLLLNELPENLRGGTMVEENKKDGNKGSEPETVPKTQYQAVLDKLTEIEGKHTTLTTDFDALKNKAEKLKGLKEKAESDLSEANDKITELKKTVKPYLDKEKDKRDKLVNSFIDDVEDEEEKKALKDKLDKTDISVLELLGDKVLNGTKPGEKPEETGKGKGSNKKGIAGKGGVKGSNPSKDKNLSPTDKARNEAIDKYKPTFEKLEP